MPVGRVSWGGQGQGKIQPSLEMAGFKWGGRQVDGNRSRAAIPVLPPSPLTREERSAEHKGAVPVLPVHEVAADLEPLRSAHVVVEAVQIVHVTVLDVAVVDHILLHCDLRGEGGGGGH